MIMIMMMKSFCEMKNLRILVDGGLLWMRVWSDF
jgi:hypothetical protein